MVILMNIGPLPRSLSITTNIGVIVNIQTNYEPPPFFKLVKMNIAYLLD